MSDKATPKPQVVPDIESAKEKAKPQAPRTFPLSDASKLIVEMAVEAMNVAAAQFEAAKELSGARARAAWKNDELPEVKQGEFLGANIVDGQWVEVLPQDIQGPGQ